MTQPTGSVAPSASGHTEALGAFLDGLEAPAPSPCGGTAAAVSAAMAAALVAMVARGSAGWVDGPGIASQARTLRSRLLTLGDDDAAAFGQVLATIRDRSGTAAQRDFALGETLLRAAEVPLRIAEAGADVTELAALAVTEGVAHLGPDATAAATLAEAAVRAAAHLVEINLTTVTDDRQSERAALLAEAAATARARALASAERAGNRGS